MIEKINKSYNPFKLWGSWFGAYILTPLIMIFGDSSVSATIHKFIFGSTNASGQVIHSSFFDVLIAIFNALIYEPFWHCSGEDCMGILFLPIPIIIGFLIGWGIHSLIRKLKK